MINTMQALADRGRYVGEEDPGYFVIESITVGADGTTAEVVSCWSTDRRVVWPTRGRHRPVGPDNPATLVNNTPGSGTADATRLAAIVGFAWRLDGSDRFDDRRTRTNVAPEA